MASSPNSIFITNVEGFGDLLKVWGQRNRTCATYVDKQLMQLCPEFNRMPPPPANRLDKGIICFAKRSDGKYYRARVISDVCNNTVMVLYIDYGHRGTVDVSCIRLRNESTDGVISAIVAQAEEFFLANVGSPGGWHEEVLNEVRRDLCYKEYNYRLNPTNGQKFIHIMYHKDDYSSLMLRRTLATHFQVADQAFFLKFRCKPPHMTLNQQPKIPEHIPSPGYPNNVNQAVNRNNNNDTKPVLNSVMIEALADQLKQHLLKDNATTPPEPTSHSYVTQVLEVGTTHNIYVSHIDDGPWSFSIQLVSSEHELNKLMDDLAACDLIPIKPPVVLGCPCIAKSKEYDNYCRGVVVNISHSAVKIFFVDFGNTEDLPVSSIFELPVRFFKVKAMSQKFALSGLQKIKPSPEIKKAFVEVVENELLLLHVTTLEGENLPTCDLYLKNVNIKRILNEKVLQIRKWAPVQPPQQGDVESVVVTWIDSPQRFFVQLKKNDRELESLRMELAQWGATGDVINPDELVPGALCVCCFTGDNEWYRAIVTSINSKNSVTVFYVDFGNTEEVRPSAIKRIGDGLIRQLNAQAIQCCLHGFENKQADSDLKTVLEALILEKELRLKVVYTDKDRIVVKLFDKDNDISLSLADSRMTTKTSPKYGGGDNAREETGKGKTDGRRSDGKNRKPEDKSWRKKEERSPRSDVSSEGEWRSDDSRISKDDRRGRTKRYGFNVNRREAGNEEKNWRNRDEVKVEKKGKAKPESVMERARRAARETQEKGMKMYDMSNTKYPVKLENMALHDAVFKDKHIPIGSVEEVIVTYFLNPNEIYVQLLSTKEDFRKVMDDIQSYYATKLPVAKYPKKGDVVVAKFKGDEVLYRASVIDSNPLSVRYADYGNEEVTERDRLWPMDKKFLELEAQAIKCSLPNLLPNGADTWPVPEAQIDKIFEFETYTCKFLNCVGNVYEVCLTISENGKDVRDELISIGFALPAENKTAPQEGVKHCPSVDLTLMRNETYKSYVSHVADPSEFYIQVERDALVLLEEEVKKCAEAQKSVDSNSVSEGGVYLANTDGDTWRRVKVLKKEESGVFVQLIDYGDKLEVPYEQVKTVPDEVLGYPPQAVRCCLFTDTEEYPSETADKLRECDKNVFIAYVHDVLENRLRVTLYNTKGEKLDWVEDDAPAVIRPITSMPITRQGIPVASSHITSPNEVYIQRSSDIPALEELNAAMLEFYSSGGEDLEEGSKLCAAKSIADECWYRARVLMSTEDHVKVFYIDFGNMEEVPVGNVKKLDPVHWEQHAFCRKISLNVSYDPEAETELSSKLCGLIADKECLGYFAKVDDVMYGELILDGGAVGDRLLSDKVKRVRDGMFRAVKVEEATEKDFGVFISHVSSPSEFWVHHESISNELEAFQEKLQDACASAAVKTDLRVGDFVGALYTDQLWYRSKVVAVEGDTPTVQFIDYGNSLKLDASGSVVELAEDLAKAPPFARFCSLKGQWKGTAAARFEEIITINQDPFALVELEDGNVDLVQNGVSVTEQLISEGYHGVDPEDDDVYITHINTPNDFYIQRDSDKSLFDTLISGLLEADMFEDLEEVKEGEIYCAKFPENEMWYRAKVLKKTANGAHVHFIDYGNDCSVTDIKALPSEFLTIPPLALNCCLLYGQTNDTWSEAACKKFMEYTNDSPFRMEIVLPGTRRSVVRFFTEDGENLTGILEKLCEPDDREFVCITHINSPNDFYVQRVDNENFDVVEERLKEGDTFEDLDVTEVGTVCCVKHEDTLWYRVEVRSIGDQCDVFAIDYGYTWQARSFKALPDDVKTIPPLAKNCSLDLTNIPETIKEEFVRLTEQNGLLKLRVMQAGEREVVSLILDGMKLEEVLLYSIAESEMYNGVETEYRDVRNETDEEKRVKYSVMTSDNTEGFRSDDEKGNVNVPDNELLNGEEEEEEEEGATGGETAEDTIKYYEEPENTGEETPKATAREKVPFDEKMTAAAVNGTMDDTP